MIRKIARIKLEIGDEEQCFNTTIAAIQKEIEHINQDNRDSEGRLEGRRNDQLNKMKMAGQIIRAIDNLYQIVLQESGLKKNPDMHIMTTTQKLITKLEFICERLEFLLIVVKERSLIKFQEFIGFKEN